MGKLCGPEFGGGEGIFRRKVGDALPFPLTLALEDTDGDLLLGGWGGTKFDLVGGGGAGAGAFSASDKARTRAGGAGRPNVLGTGRAGGVGGAGDRCGTEGPALEGRGGGGGGAGLPGREGGGGTFLPGDPVACNPFRGGMAGTGRAKIADPALDGGDADRGGIAGTERDGSAGADDEGRAGGAGVEGEGRAGGAGGEGVGRAGVGGAEILDGGGLRGGEGTLILGAGIARAGGSGVGRLGGAGAKPAGLGGGGLAGGAGTAEILLGTEGALAGVAGVCRDGIDGGLPRARGLAELF
jgi:hypothetical protein